MLIDVSINLFQQIYKNVSLLVKPAIISLTVKAIRQMASTTGLFVKVDKIHAT